MGRNWWEFSFRWRGWGAVLVLAVGWLALFSLGLLARAFSWHGRGLLAGRVCLFWACFGGWLFCWCAGDIGAGLLSACFGRLVGDWFWRWFVAGDDWLLWWVVFLGRFGCGARGDF